MFMKTNGFSFVDIIKYQPSRPTINYLGYQWVKAYSCSVQKSWLPYEWFRNPEKLSYLWATGLLGMIFTFEG